jgi:chemotaxis protein methyltransferase CheR
VGKELIARAIHNVSSRKDRPLVKVNCAALPATLIESELFGHEKGAFSGAHAKQVGRFELADGSTIFLDEIGELPVEVQAKLLRVLQDGEFERLGSPRTLRTNTRIIAATNRNLEEEVRRGRFRKDLWYRINVFPITVPPLRERRQDISLLADTLTRRSAKKLGKKIEKIPLRTMKDLQEYSWPGNVREMENVIERAVINSEGPLLILADRLQTRDPIVLALEMNANLVELERRHIIQVLEGKNWRIAGKNGAAALLGLNPSTLRGRMRKLGLRRRSTASES